jgi:quercetin dioxygenase-like cupin family protein
MSVVHMRALRPASLGLIAVFVAFGAKCAFAAEETAMTTPAHELSYARLYPGPDGISHFANVKMEFVPLGAAGVEAVLGVHSVGDVRGVAFLRLKAGTTEDWHTAPRRQFMVCIGGLVEVTAGDGEKRQIRPGGILLLEDVTGKGHLTHAVGPDDHVALAIPVAAAAQP